MQRAFVVMVVAASLVLAGCVGGGGDAAGTPDSDDSGANDGAVAGDGAGANVGTFEFFEFDSPATYTYDIYLEGEGEGQMVWDVTAVSGDTATVTLTYDLGGTSFETTASGTRDEVQSALVQSPAAAFLSLGVFSPYYAYYEERGLRIGEQWSYTTGEGSASFAVTERTSHAGVDCYRTEMRVDGNLFHAACVSPDLGLSAYSGYFNEDGSRLLELELTNYQSG